MLNRILLLFPAIVPFAAASEDHVWARLGIPDPLMPLAWALLILIVCVAGSIYYKNSMGKNMKKGVFILVAVSTMSATLYLGGATVYLNLVSATGGPIHWHADYEVWACGTKYELIDPIGFDNRVGPPLLHEHNDNRIHVEGVPLHLTDITLGEFFRAVGGDFTGVTLQLSTNSGVKQWTTGQNTCNGQPSRWHVFVNEELIEEPQNHVYAPHSTVPPGDIIKMVFTEKADSQINRKLFEVP